MENLNQARSVGNCRTNLLKGILQKLVGLGLSLLVMQADPASACSPTTGPGQAERLIDPETMPVGSYEPDSLASQVTNSPGRILVQNYWTTADARYISSALPDDPVFVTRLCSRDQEVETWMRNGRVYLRLTDDGRAILFHLNQETPRGSLTIALVSGKASTSGRPEKLLTLYNNTDLVGAWKNFARDKPLVDNQRFTFGAEGFDIYVRVNGVEVVRLKDIHHVASGAIALAAPQGYGFRRTALHHLPEIDLRSDPALGKLDVRDFGFREESALGSISAGSSTLSLAAPSNYHRGDYIIVPVGDESGKGTRGTMGVGGSWPARFYASLASMAEDPSRSDGTYAWRADTGDVYRFSAAQREWTKDYQAKKYYPAKAAPRALHAQVISLSDSGRTLELDRAAVAGVEHAPVYLDVAPIINQLTHRFRSKYGTDLREFLLPQMEIVLPAGKYALGSPISIVERSNIVIQGAGRGATTLFSPPGVPSASISVTGATNAVRDLTLIGNARDNGFGLAWQAELLPSGHAADGMVEFQSPAAPVSETAIARGAAYPTGIKLSGRDHEVRDVEVVDVFQGAVTASFCKQCWAYDVHSRMTQGLRTYVQWMVLWADSVGGGCIDCSVTSPTLIGGFAGFKSREVEFRRPHGVNASMDMNRVGAWSIRDPHLVFKALSQGSDRAFSEYAPAIVINTNAGGNVSVEEGGQIINPTIIVEDYINNDANGMIGIAINASNPNVTIQGGYVSGPGWRPPSRLGTPVGVNSQGRNTIVDGLRVAGTTNPAVWPPGNIVVSDGLVLNCVADLIHLGSNARSQGCITNAEAARKATRR